jgi:hypothetical protein
VGNFAVLHIADFIPLQLGGGDMIPFERLEADQYGRLAGDCLGDIANVTRSQPVFGDVNIQYDLIILAYHVKTSRAKFFLK